ncbi:MAG: hypothetical protein IKI75_07650 [Lachnospiraceae bacterium]|nr:hypothetical protein [Lachnospiraceae bacterium]
MRNNYPNLVIAYHGCDESVRDAVVMGQELKRSENPYDWLGNGIYFWENDEQRAMEWAVALSKKGKIRKPSVLGAVLDLGRCLNLTERESIDVLALGYEILLEKITENGGSMPENRNLRDDQGWLLRERDCAVIEQIHEYVRANGLPAYDSVRGLFQEGESAYPGSGFKKKTHTQICVVNPNCIIGCFIPRGIDPEYPQP